MTRNKRTPRGEILRHLLLDLEQLHGLLEQRAGDLTREFAETPARYKVLTAAGCDRHTVPQIARRMGMTRQGVQKIVNQLLSEKRVKLMPNLDHQGSPIVELTDEGRRVDDAISALIAMDNDRHGRHFRTEALRIASQTLSEICRLLADDIEGTRTTS